MPSYCRRSNASKIYRVLFFLLTLATLCFPAHGGMEATADHLCAGPRVCRQGPVGRACVCCACVPGVLYPPPDPVISPLPVLTNSQLCTTSLCFPSVRARKEGGRLGKHVASRVTADAAAASPRKRYRLRVGRRRCAFTRAWTVAMARGGARGGQGTRFYFE